MHVIACMHTYIHLSYYHLRRSAMTGGVAVAELAVGHGAVGVRDGGAGARPGGAVSGKTTGVSG